jgi:hypothetical protein
VLVKNRCKRFCQHVTRTTRPDDTVWCRVCLAFPHWSDFTLLISLAWVPHLCQWNARPSRNSQQPHSRPLLSPTLVERWSANWLTVMEVKIKRGGWTARTKHLTIPILDNSLDAPTLLLFNLSFIWPNTLRSHYTRTLYKIK